MAETIMTWSGFYSAAV